MATVGGVSCDIMHGRLPVKSQSTDVWRVPGVDGYGAQITGLANGEFRVQVVGYETGSNLQAWHVSLAALVGQLITVVDDWGSSWNNVLLLKISPLSEFGPARWAKPGVVTNCCRAVVEIEGVVT